MHNSVFLPTSRATKKRSFEIIHPGEISREIYGTKLTSQFNHRKFIVTFNGKEGVGRLIDYVLFLYSAYKRNQNHKKTGVDDSEGTIYEECGVRNKKIETSPLFHEKDE